MRMTLMVHMVAGTFALVCGYIALYSAKGGAAHRKSGMLFVYAMLTMAFLGSVLAISRDKTPAVNIPAALLTSYLTITALITVRPPAKDRRWFDIGAMLVALAVGTTMLTFGLEALANGGKRGEIPAFPFFMFGIVGTLGTVGDVRVLRSGALKGAARLARHLWRMSFALFIAALSAGQLMKMIPEPYRVRGLLVLPLVAVLVPVIYWLWRLRRKGAARRIPVIVVILVFLHWLRIRVVPLLKRVRTRRESVVPKHA